MTNGPTDTPDSMRSGPSRPQRMDVRITGDDLRSRTARERTQSRLLGVSVGFCALFGAVALKLAAATVIMPMEPERRQVAPQVPTIPKSDPKGMMAGDFALPQVHRASITDRNGQVLAISLPVAQVYANPQEMIDPQDAAQKLKSVLPALDTDETIRRLSTKKQFVYLARDISPMQEVAINNLGIPGIYFEPGERRHYPLGRVAAHIMGAVDIDDHGVAGVERFLDKRLDSDRTPLRLSLDVRIQAVVRDELAAAKDMFQAIGACAIVMDVNTGEIIAMVSLPDYDANDFGRADPDARFNRAVTGMYEPGSTFKLQTAAMALQMGVAHIWDRFSTIPIHIGRFTISDMKTDHFAPWLSLPGVMAFSSNPAAAHIALDVGAQRQQDWLRKMGFFSPAPIELPEAGRPIVPQTRNWGISTVMTVGFGHGVAEPPLAIVRGTAATVNGGLLLHPTLLARDDAGTDAPAAPSSDPSPTEPGAPAAAGTRVISPEISALLRRILRLDVTQGTGKSAESPGYFVGGKTGTAEKIGPHGGYLKHVNVAAFTSIFPMNAPRYAVYVMLDSPKATPQTHGWTTAAWNAAPTVSKIVTRIGPMLGLFPNTANAQAIDEALAIPMEPAVPRGYRALGPGNDPGDPRNAPKPPKTPKKGERHGDMPVADLSTQPRLHAARAERAARSSDPMESRG
ncbi:Peptidoglycan glycosyltransferase [Gluconacetobacter diazotrophicus PA1 5]|uniref:Penicillin-binding protein 2 n=2 Tax=Gluconacetobacter diazotrophicus TaxID=33996 RepID=A0A7W4I7Z7_GLUDI|nr:penicillin-binding protein 2 [Gluconacetobacter diazotrophicus]ACI52906.1 Peptidoglycan glycosyltransferase [Gluconacetobacter diazotrophicus PA1 5]MBB2157894.1 penicillin-binding protein 2 [Gluconacetobacter diazotrophicus]TWB08949.1 cell division protein FtsI (penicillin-binding protein 3) [Gluconacetobacter diazotrophicus]CAP57128.1 putative peptidoglycan synthetase ftsI [Gluconacetobacter diazotrophicus PA1 5]